MGPAIGLRLGSALLLTGAVPWCLAYGFYCGSHQVVMGAALALVVMAPISAIGALVRVYGHAMAGRPRDALVVLAACTSVAATVHALAVPLVPGLPRLSRQEAA